jgi:hypothetical protein
MANFFDGNPATDFNGLIAYIKSHTLDQTLAEIRASKINPNDLPGLGDTAKLFLKEDGYAHARVFYAEGIRQLEAAPHLVAPDVNVLFARRNLCALYMPDQAGDALAVIEEDPQLIGADPALALWIAATLAETGQMQEADWILSAIDQIPQAQLLPKLEEYNFGIDQVNALRASVRKQLRDERRQLAVQYFNMAHESIRKGDRSEAVQHYLTCMDLAGEENAQDRTYKAFVAYQCGVCLLKQFSLDGGAPEWFSKPQEQAAAQLKDLWKTTLRLYQTLGREDLETDFGKMLRRHVPDIVKDRLMR